jgi:hypothetical protein
MAVLSWNEILQRDKQAQMTGASGLTPEQLGAIREADLTEGAVNARNIFNQNEINRRNAVAEKNASDMLKANKGAQNVQSAIKLGMMAKEYYPQVKNAVGGLFDTATTTGAGMALDVASNAAPTAINLANTASSSTATGAVDMAAGWGAEGAAEAAPSMFSNVAGSVVSNITPIVQYAAWGKAVNDFGKTLEGSNSGAVRAVGRGITGGPADALFTDDTTQGAVAALTADPTHAANKGMDLVWKGDIGGAFDKFFISPIHDLGEKVGCIIVTACTSSTSYEVEVARQYRDKFLTSTQLRGYYILAEKLVPTLENNEKIRNFTKTYLVDKLIDYGELKLGLVDKCKLSSRIVSNLFLGLIKTIGFFIPKYTRLNGEIY